MKYLANTMGYSFYWECKSNDIASIIKWIKTRQINSFEISFFMRGIDGRAKYALIVFVKDGIVEVYNEFWKIPKTLEKFIESYKGR